jgi:hypothetical protein
MKYAIAFLLSLLFVANARALITFSLGNDPVQDADWPAGAVAVANLKTRGGHWDGPPLGGGHSHFEYKGTTKDLQEALDAFAKVRWPELRLVIHTGPNLESFIYGKDQDKDAPGPDWTFAVWNPRSFYEVGERSGRSAARGLAAERAGRTIEPPTMDVYVTPRIDWKQITIPKNLKVTDERATSHGYTAAEGSVCRGDIYDMVDSKPVAGATFTLLKHNGKEWAPVLTARSDADGHFELKNIPPDRYIVSVSSPDHAYRSIGFGAIAADTLKEYVVMLAPPARVSGVVKDESGKPLAGVKVSSEGTIAVDGSGYAMDKRIEATTDADGRFEMTGLPAGTVSFSTHAPGAPRVDTTPYYPAPAENLELRAMTK